MGYAGDAGFVDIYYRKKDSNDCAVLCKELKVKHGVSQNCHST